MRDDQPQGIAMVARERLAVMVGSKEHILAVKVNQGHVGGEALFGMDQHVLRFRLELYQLQNLLKGYALPVIVKAAPARNAMEITVRFNLGQRIEFVPFEP